MKFDWTQGELAEGLRWYDAGEFFAAHEAWESVWLKRREPMKTFLQGLIQVAAAFHHLEDHNPLGTALLLQAALRRLSVIRPTLEVSPSLYSAMTFASGYRRSSGPTGPQLVSARIVPI